MSNKGSLYSILYYLAIALIVITIIVVVLIFYNTRKSASKPSSDRYSDFEELKKNTTKNKDWRIVTKHRKDNNILLTAIHGGGIEPGTTELARRVSNVGKYNFYSFEGLRKHNNDQLHVTSTNYDEPKLIKMLEKSKETISIHGSSGDDPIVYIGGKDTKMSKSIAKALRKKDFTVKESPKELNAQSDDNFVNKNDTDSGVQLELTTAQREEFFKHHKLDKTTRGNPKKYTRDFYKFANAVEKGIKKAK